MSSQAQLLSSSFQVTTTDLAVRWFDGTRRGKKREQRRAEFLRAQDKTSNVYLAVVGNRKICESALLATGLFAAPSNKTQKAGARERGGRRDGAAAARAGRNRARSRERPPGRAARDSRGGPSPPEELGEFMLKDVSSLPQVAGGVTKSEDSATEKIPETEGFFESLRVLGSKEVSSFDNDIVFSRALKNAEKATPLTLPDFQIVVKKNFPSDEVRKWMSIPLDEVELEHRVGVPVDSQNLRQKGDRLLTKQDVFRTQLARQATLDFHASYPRKLAEMKQVAAAKGQAQRALLTEGGEVRGDLADICRALADEDASGDEDESKGRFVPLNGPSLSRRRCPRGRPGSELSLTEEFVKEISDPGRPQWISKLLGKMKTEVGVEEVAFSSFTEDGRGPRTQVLRQDASKSPSPARRRSAVRDGSPPRRVGRNRGPKEQGRVDPSRPEGAPAESKAGELPYPLEYEPFLIMQLGEEYGLGPEPEFHVFAKTDIPYRFATKMGVVGTGETNEELRASRSWIPGYPLTRPLQALGIRTTPDFLYVALVAIKKGLQNGAKASIGRGGQRKSSGGPKGKSKSDRRKHEKNLLYGSSDVAVGGEDPSLPPDVETAYTADEIALVLSAQLRSVWNMAGAAGESRHWLRQIQLAKGLLNHSPRGGSLQQMVKSLALHVGETKETIFQDTQKKTRRSALVEQSAGHPDLQRLLGDMLDAEDALSQQGAPCPELYAWDSDIDLNQAWKLTSWAKDSGQEDVVKKGEVSSGNAASPSTLTVVDLVELAIRPATYHDAAPSASPTADRISLLERLMLLCLSQVKARDMHIFTLGITSSIGPEARDTEFRDPRILLHGFKTDNKQVWRPASIVSRALPKPARMPTPVTAFERAKAKAVTGLTSLLTTGSFPGGAGVGVEEDHDEVGGVAKFLDMLNTQVRVTPTRRVEELALGLGGWTTSAASKNAVVDPNRLKVVNVRSVLLPPKGGFQDNLPGGGADSPVNSPPGTGSFGDTPLVHVDATDKPVRWQERGNVFRTAREAAEWLKFKRTHLHKLYRNSFHIDEQTGLELSLEDVEGAVAARRRSVSRMALVPRAASQEGRRGSITREGRSQSRRPALLGNATQLFSPIAEESGASRAPSLVFARGQRGLSSLRQPSVRVRRSGSQVPAFGISDGDVVSLSPVTIETITYRLDLNLIFPGTISRAEGQQVRAEFSLTDVTNPSNGFRVQLPSDEQISSETRSSSRFVDVTLARVRETLNKMPTQTNWVAGGVFETGSGEKIPRLQERVVVFATDMRFVVPQLPSVADVAPDRSSGEYVQNAFGLAWPVLRKIPYDQVGGPTRVSSNLPSDFLVDLLPVSETGFGGVLSGAPGQSWLEEVTSGVVKQTLFVEVRLMQSKFKDLREVAGRFSEEFAVISRFLREERGRLFQVWWREQQGRGAVSGEEVSREVGTGAVEESSLSPAPGGVAAAHDQQTGDNVCRTALGSSVPVPLVDPSSPSPFSRTGSEQNENGGTGSMNFIADLVDAEKTDPHRLAAEIWADFVDNNLRPTPLSSGKETSLCARLQSELDAVLRLQLLNLAVRANFVWVLEDISAEFLFVLKPKMLAALGAFTKRRAELLQERERLSTFLQNTQGVAQQKFQERVEAKEKEVARLVDEMKAWAEVGRMLDSKFAELESGFEVMVMAWAGSGRYRKDPQNNPHRIFILKVFLLALFLVVVCWYVSSRTGDVLVGGEDYCAK